MMDKTWRVSYMRTEPGALSIMAFHAKKLVAHIVVTTEERVIVLTGEKENGTTTDSTKKS